MKHNISEQGRSMIEMLGVLAIVGVLSVGGIAGYSKAMNKFKTNKMIDQVNMVATNIRTLYASQRTYAGLNNKVAKQTGVIPAEMYTSETTSLITNAFGGKMFVGPAKQSDTANDSFVILITQIPQPACVSIATTEWGADSGSGLIGMEIMADYAATGTNVLGSFSSSAVAASLNDTNAKGVNNLPYSIVDASTWCSSEGELNTIVWKYL